MTLSSKVPVKCPKCGNVWEHEVWDSIDTDSIDKKIDQKIMDWEFFVYKCPSCNSKTEVWTPLLYSDRERNFMIYFIPDKTQKIDLNTWKIKLWLRNRIVRTPQDLREKIMIFSDWLDDGIMEILKLSIITNYFEKEMAQISSINYYLWTIADGLLFHIYFTDNRPVKKVYVPYEEYKRYNDTEKCNIPNDKFVEVSPFTIMNYVEPHEDNNEEEPEMEDEGDDMTFKEKIIKSIEISNPDDELHFSKLFDDNSWKYEHFLFHKKASIKIDKNKYYIILSMSDKDESVFQVLRFPWNELQELFDKAKNKDWTLDEFIKIYFKDKHAYWETWNSEPIDITKYRFNFLLEFLKHSK